MAGSSLKASPLYGLVWHHNASLNSFCRFDQAPVKIKIGFGGLRQVFAGVDSVSRQKLAVGQQIQVGIYPLPLRAWIR